MVEDDALGVDEDILYSVAKLLLENEFLLPEAHDINKLLCDEVYGSDYMRLLGVG